MDSLFNNDPRLNQKNLPNITKSKSDLIHNNPSTTTTIRLIKVNQQKPIIHHHHHQLTSSSSSSNHKLSSNHPTRHQPSDSKPIIKKSNHNLNKRLNQSTQTSHTKSNSKKPRLSSNSFTSTNPSSLIKDLQQQSSSTSKPFPTQSNSSPFSVTHSLEPNRPIGKVTSSIKLVNAHQNHYKPWFNNLTNPTPHQCPHIQVLYPTGAHETFPLLVPKNDELDDYRPLDDLFNVITTTLTYYLTPDQSRDYFSEPHPIPSNSSTAPKNISDFRFLVQSSSSSSPRSSPNQSPNQSSSESLKPSGESRHTIPLADRSLDLSSKPLLKELLKAIRRKNGPEFVSLIGWYNTVIRHLISHGALKKQIGRLPKGIWETVLGQAYDRQVGPKLEVLQEYETWSSNVYGELKQKFVSEIIDLVGLQPGQIFVDLGSGIGNVVLQVALEVGCVSVGFEIMNGCNDLAQNQLAEVVGRCHSLWGVSLGQPILFQADFTKDPRVGHWLAQADVVLVNNQVFTPSLNESLTLLFLELKDSAKIVSLKPFIPTTFKITQRNLDSPLAILSWPSAGRDPLNQTPGVFKYGSDSVSWTDNPGEYFLTIVDRSKLIAFQSSLNPS